MNPCSLQSSRLWSSVGGAEATVQVRTGALLHAILSDYYLTLACCPVAACPGMPAHRSGAVAGLPQQPQLPSCTTGQALLNSWSKQCQWQ
jgi:hypothetical protein